MSLTKKLISTLGFLLIFGCQQNGANEPTDTSQPKAANATPIVKKEPVELKPVLPQLAYQGTIQYIQLEGGFFGIISSKGVKILPMNLASEFKQDGAIVEFSGDFQKDVMTIQQWGAPFKISKMKLIKAGKPGGNSLTH